MKNRNFNSVIFALGFFFTSLPASAANDVGRFQLFQGEYRFINLKGEEHWSRALFKVDTTTGKIYICEQDQVLGKHINKKGESYQRRYCVDFDQDIEIPNYAK
jgi:hypothetical protein